MITVAAFLVLFCVKDIIRCRQNVPLSLERILMLYTLIIDVSFFSYRHIEKSVVLIWCNFNLFYLTIHIITTFIVLNEDCFQYIKWIQIWFLFRIIQTLSDVYFPSFVIEMKFCDRWRRMLRLYVFRMWIREDCWVLPCQVCLLTPF